jgi:hypothetical protein
VHDEPLLCNIKRGQIHYIKCSVTSPCGQLAVAPYLSGF